MYRLTYLLVAIALTSCAGDHPEPSPNTIINDRQNHATYRAITPPGWRALPPETDLADTRLPIASFLIDEAILVTIHNFPALQSDKRIPPIAQVQRWLEQLKDKDPAATVTRPIAWSGFQGWQVVAHNAHSGVMGWALALPDRLFRRLDDPEKRADITIKAVGPKDALLQHQSALAHFAESFELIEAIP